MREKKDSYVCDHLNLSSLRDSDSVLLSHLFALGLMSKMKYIGGGFRRRIIQDNTYFKASNLRKEPIKQKNLEE